MITHYDLSYSDNLHLDLFLPETESFDLLVYIHGGGLNSYSHKGFDPYADYFAKANFATASIEYLPTFVADSIKSAISAFDNKIHGFARKEAILTGAETRTSAPIRILRNNDTKLALGFENLYPAGAGGN